MARHVLLNNIEHKALRIDTRRTAELGDQVMYAQVVPSEFRQLQEHYPIVFTRGSQGDLLPVALFGLRQGENLFLQGEGWDARYLPHVIERQPFAIGHQDQELVLHLDLDSPRVGQQVGEALFLEHGGTTAYLDRISSVLSALNQGLPQIPVLMGLLQEYQLLESFVLDFSLEDGAPQRLSGFHTLHEERLGHLDGEALQRFQQAGLLEPLYMIIASLSNFRGLIERFNRAHGHQH
ncbi:MAG TPA: SapC family protein [Pseudoxanthomonas sp.]|nr:SapC family protein [Pseudoxanthomonas sp.]